MKTTNKKDQTIFEGLAYFKKHVDDHMLEYRKKKIEEKMKKYQKV